jgi:membrane protein
MSDSGQGGTTRTKLEPWRARVDALRGTAERTIVWRVWVRMLETEFVDRSVALAAKAFVSFFPVVIVVAALAPPSIRTSIFTTITSRFGLSGEALSTARNAFGSANDVRKATGIVGLVFTLFYATSFFTALQRVYLRAWRRPSGRNLVNYVRGPAWMAGVLAYFTLLGATRSVLGSGPGTAGFLLVSLVGAIALWWLTAWVMLLGQVRWRVVLVSGLITGIAQTGYTASAAAWMPGIVTRNQAQFGFFGVSLALVTWFSGAAICVVVGACAAPVLAEDPGRVGRWVRGRSPSVLVPGAATPLPPPPRRPLLADALSDSEDDDALRARSGQGDSPGSANSPPGATRA